MGRAVCWLVSVARRTLLALALAACATISAREGIEPTDLSPVRVGADRETVESVLGTVVMSERSGDLTTDTYEYDLGQLPRDVDESGFAAEVLFLQWQPFVAAAVAESREAQKRRLRITYDSSDRVVKLDPAIVEERRKLSQQIRQAYCGGATTQYMAGYRHQYGIGAPPSRVRAYFWYSLSASHGRAEAKWQRGKLKTAMTSKELTEAEERLRSWTAPDCDTE